MKTKRLYRRELEEPLPGKSPVRGLKAAELLSCLMDYCGVPCGLADEPMRNIVRKADKYMNGEMSCEELDIACEAIGMHPDYFKRKCREVRQSGKVKNRHPDQFSAKGLYQCKTDGMYSNEWRAFNKQLDKAINKRWPNRNKTKWFF